MKGIPEKRIKNDIVLAQIMVLCQTGNTALIFKMTNEITGGLVGPLLDRHEIGMGEYSETCL